MLTNARNLTLADLRQNFGLLPNTTDRYFQDWLNHLPPLTPDEITAIDRLATNYEYLSESDSPLEEVIKLVVLSPLLDLAGFYRSPFLPKAEVSTSLEIADEPDASPIQGKIDVLILQYLKSMAYRLLDSLQERIQILQALKYIGQQISGF
jgi:AraC-like DNA-binding protein